MTDITPEDLQQTDTKFITGERATQSESREREKKLYLAQLSAPPWLLDEIKTRPSFRAELETVGSAIELSLENPGHAARAFRLAMKDMSQDELLLLQEKALSYFASESATFKVFQMGNDGGLGGILTPSDEVSFAQAVSKLNGLVQTIGGQERKGDLKIFVSDSREQIGVTRIAQNHTAIDSIEPVSLTHISWAERGWRDGSMDEILSDTGVALVTPEQYELMRKAGIVLRDDDVFEHEKEYVCKAPSKKASVNYVVRGLHADPVEVNLESNAGWNYDISGVPDDIIASLGSLPNEAFLEKQSQRESGEHWVDQLKERGFVRIESTGGLAVVKVDISGLSKLIAGQKFNPTELLRDVLVGFSGETDKLFGDESEFVMTMQGDSITMFLPTSAEDRTEKLTALSSMLAKSSEDFTGNLEKAAEKTGNKTSVLKSINGIKVVVLASNDSSSVDFFPGGVVRVVNDDLRRNLGRYEELASAGGFSLTYVSDENDSVSPDEIFKGRRVVDTVLDEGKRLFRVEVVRPLREDLITREFITAGEQVLSETYQELHKAIARMPLEFLNVDNNDISTAKLAFLLNTIADKDREKLLEVVSRKIDDDTATELGELAQELREADEGASVFKGNIGKVYIALSESMSAI